jgi:hypothetical protein
MENDRRPSRESASDKLAALLRDCILGLLVLAMIGWFAYYGVTAIVTAHLDLGHGARLSRRWFSKPLDGPPAVLAGCAFLCLAAAFGSISTSHPMLRSRVPSCIRASYGLFFVGGIILYLAALLMTGP